MLTEEKILARSTNIINNEIFCRAPHEFVKFIELDEGYTEQLYSVPDFSDAESGCFKEPLEFYLVSNWLGKNLKEFREPTVELSTCYLWGRCTSGQYIIHDGTIQEIVKALNNEDQ